MADIVNIFRPAVPLPACFGAAWQTLGLRDPCEPVGFKFKRSLGNVEVWLFFKGGLQMNLTIQNGMQLKNFFDARGWAHGYAVRCGFEAFEIKRQKSRPPTLRLVLQADFDKARE